MVRLNLIIALIFGLATLVIWFAFLRPVPIQTSTGTVLGRTYREGGTYWQGHHAASRGFRTPTPIPIAEAWVFEIAVEGFSEPFRYALNTTASGDFGVGDTVRVEYQRRGVPPFWTRRYVLTMEPAREQD
jgi:hypothetical protein